MLVVDIDNDIAEVWGEPVIVGEEKVREAILRFGVNRPEDSDVNAMLAGLSVYNRLKEEGRRPLIIVVGGHRADIYEALRLIRQRVESVLENLGLKGEVEFILVSDGEDEFMVTEVLRELGPIASFKRVIVEQHLGLEASYMLLLRYIRKAATDPRFSKYLLGVPGSILVLIAVASLGGFLDTALKLAVLVVGGAMTIRGFNLERYIGSIMTLLMEELRKTPLGMVGLALLGIFALASLYIIVDAIVSVEQVNVKIVSIIGTAIPLLAIGAFVFVLISRILSKLVEGEFGILRDIEFAIVLIGIGLSFYNLGSYMESILSSSAQQAPSLSSILPSALTESNFISIAVAFSGLAGLVEIANRALYKRAGDKRMGEVGS
ncbi:MAG: DUF373 family protein [Desulfurococcales archaeon]|nr:DUF373 family protein [Desulfurococcales archaeon]